MGIPMLKQCCCGCTLKTGSIIIAILNIISGIYFLVAGIVVCNVETKSAESENVFVAVGAVLATIGALVLLAGLCLCIGAMKEIANLMIPYMVLAILSIVANVITSSIAASDLYDAGLSQQGTSQVVSLVIYVVLQTYFLLVVYSLYRQLKGTEPSMNP